MPSPMSYDILPIWVHHSLGVPGRFLEWAHVLEFFFDSTDPFDGLNTPPD
uniref:Uncharacterized protein n=1 Tax=Solanum lycopersicum TaxID=4081 RepID=A0A3Q7G351_SOLLC